MTVWFTIKTKPSSEENMLKCDVSSRAKRLTYDFGKLVHPVFFGIARGSSGVIHVVIVVAEKVGSVKDVIVQ